MKRNLFLVGLYFWVFGLGVWGQNSAITLVIPASGLPDYTPIEGSLYVSGSFNNWHPGRSDSRLIPDGSGNYSLMIDSLTNGATIEYKFTRGNWDYVETQANGTFLNNRTFIVNNGSTPSHSIGNWDDMSNPSVPNSATGKVRILNSDFAIPQLNRKRRIWVYLPPDYAFSGKRYPVIYMQDGQNIFDNATSFSGEWGLDESMEQLFTGGNQGAIIVGIDNGGATRLDEYSPWVNTQYGGGEGDEYASFIVNTLKPHIDSIFRTETGRDYTAIGGSSMGGLISLYTGIEYQNVFSKILVFSPSFWFSQECFNHAQTKGKQYPMRIYLMCGTQEGNGSVVTDMQQMYNTLISSGFNAQELNFVTKSDGQHSEWFWKREFPDAYQWLFNTQTTAVQYSIDEELPFILSPIPFHDSLNILWKSPIKEFALALYNDSGQNVYFNNKAGSQVINTEKLPKGIYLLIIEYNGMVFRKKVLKG